MSSIASLGLGLSVLLGEFVGAHEADRGRISRHLQAVEAELRARDVGELPPALQEQRLRNLERLRVYAQAGQYPHNEDFPGERVPYFIDADGVPCAVGFLVIDSGFADVARQIEASENNARLLAMTHPALPAWIAASGLTAAECAQIQPSYCDCGDVFAPVCGTDGVTYTSECVAQQCAGVEVAHEGPCEGRETTTDWPNPGTEADPGTTTGGETGASSGETGASSGTTLDASTGEAATGGATSTGAATSTGSDSSGDATTGVVTGGVGSSGSTGDDEASDSGDLPTTTTKPSGCQGCRSSGEGGQGGASLLGLLVLAALCRRRA